MVLQFLLLMFVGLCIGLFAIWYYQRKLIYYPDVTRVLPQAIGLSDVEERVLKRPGDVAIIVWFGRPRPGQPTILYFHGNAGNLANRAERIAAYRSAGRGFAIMSYRGYGGSTGSPSEADNVADALATFDLLLQEGIASQDIILYGESLGSGVAVQVAEKHQVGGIILDAPFTSLADVGARVYPYLPVRFALADRYESLARIASVSAPLLVIHGERDEIVPYSMGVALFAAANEPKQLAGLAEAGHSDHHRFGSFDIIQRWIDRVRAARTPVSGDSP